MSLTLLVLRAWNLIQKSIYEFDAVNTARFCEPYICSQQKIFLMIFGYD